MRNNLRRAFTQQKSNAKRRGISFRLTYDQWLAVWQRSGKLNQRGRNSGQYCMSRPNDRGVYEIGNVLIIMVNANHSDVVPYRRTAKWRQAQARRMRGNTNGLGKRHSTASRLKMSQALKGRIGGFVGKRHSRATIELKGRVWKNQFGCGPDHPEARP